jgi:hypothetical protein
MASLRRRARIRYSNPDDDRYSSANALTAAGTRVRKEHGDSLRRLIQPWQTRAFSYYDMLGEIKYAAQFYARGLSQLELYAAEIEMKEGKPEIVPTENEHAIAALERIRDPGGGRTGLLGQYGRLMFLTGEAYLFVSKDPDTDLEQWEVLSTDEIRIQDGVYLRVKAPSLNQENYHAPSDDDYEPLNEREAVAYRLWQKHPRYSMLADSTLEGVLDLCEELILLTQSVRARARSRLAGSGMLFIDDRISPAPHEPVGDEDPEEDPFLKDLIEAMTTPIVDEGAASSVVPFLVRVPVAENQKVSDLVHHLQVVDPTQLYPETGLRYECIKRIAIGLDMPPEILMGMQDSNHWTAWLVDEQTWKAHLQPKAQQLVEDLTSAYFRPTLKEAGVEGWDKFLIAYDATAIINHPDRTKDAKDLHNSLAISDQALREASGFDEDDSITDPSEMVRRIGVKVQDGVLATTGKVGATEDVSRHRKVAEGETVESGIATSEAKKEPPEQPTEPADSVEEPAAVAAAGNGRNQETVARILGSSDIALLRAREAAGNRLRSYAKRDPEALELIKGVRAGQVAAMLGRERARALKAPSERDLVAGARELIVDALRVWGIEDEDLAAKIAENVEKHAAKTLWQERPTPLPSSFTNYVAALVALSESRRVR